MYGKLFAQMYDGSLYGNWKAIVTFQQMIILCGPDGVIDMTPQALAARTSIPLDVIHEGIGILEAPDQYSRTPDQDGRRLERLDDHRPWGWRIVNYRRYRMQVSADEKRESDRQRLAAKRALARLSQSVANSRNVSQDVADSRDLSQHVADVAQAEAEAEAEVEVKKKNLAVNGRDNLTEWFERFWRAYPRKAKKPAALKSFRAAKPDEAMLAQMLSSIETSKASEQWQDRKFIPYPATWLNNRRWEEEAELPLSANHRNAVPGTRFVA